MTNQLVRKTSSFCSLQTLVFKICISLFLMMSCSDRYLPCQVIPASNSFDKRFDCIAIVAICIDALDGSLSEIKEALYAQAKVIDSYLMSVF